MCIRDRVNPGPEVGQEVQDKFLKYLKDTLKADDTLDVYKRQGLLR